MLSFSILYCSQTREGEDMSENSEIDYSKVKKFKKEFRRISLEEHPLAPGSSAIVFEEDENGEPFSVIIANNVLNPNSPAETAVKNSVLDLRYWLQVNINSDVTEETLQDFRYGLTLLDTASRDFREKATEDVVRQAKARATRIPANICVKGLVNTCGLLNEFDTCCLDFSDLQLIDLEAKSGLLAEAIQRVQPTVFIISTAAANDLTRSEALKTTVGMMLDSKIRFKSVFAKADGLENDFVRTL